jgi:hypothetical protein
VFSVAVKLFFIALSFPCFFFFWIFFLVVLVLDFFFFFLVLFCFFEVVRGPRGNSFSSFLFGASAWNVNIQIRFRSGHLLFAARRIVAFDGVVDFLSRRCERKCQSWR